MTYDLGKNWTATQVDGEVTVRNTATGETIHLGCDSVSLLRSIIKKAK